MLGDVSRNAFDAGEPLLSAVVVHKHDKQPGTGFARMARGLGFEVPDQDIGQVDFAGRELERVWAYWRRR